MPGKQREVWLVQGSSPSARRRKQRSYRMAPPATAATRRRASATPITALGNWALGNPLSAVTALGLFLYGFLRYVYARFYSPLGVKPEEVGLGYAEILSQSVTGLLLFSALMFLLLLIGGVLSVTGALLWVGLIRQFASDFRQNRRLALQTLTATAVILVLVVVVVALGWGIWLLGLFALLLVLRPMVTRKSRSRRNATPEESKSKQPATSQGKQPRPSARQQFSTARRQVRSLFARRWRRPSIIWAFLLTRDPPCPFLPSGFQRV